MVRLLDPSLDLNAEYVVEKMQLLNAYFERLEL